MTMKIAGFAGSIVASSGRPTEIVTESWRPEPGDVLEHLAESQLFGAVHKSSRLVPFAALG
jgi:hypothetical protein